MTLAATMASSVALVSQSAILGYRLSALVCILVCLIRFRGRDEETTSSWDHRIADGNIGIGPICSLQYCRRQPGLRMGRLASDNALQRHIAESPRKYSASQGYARMQSLWILRTAKAAMKKLFLTGIAVLLLATGTANAQWIPPGCGSSWQICAARIHARAVWRVKHPGVNYYAGFSRCGSYRSTLDVQRCAAQVNALRQAGK